ncbi:MAG: alpha/beta hydrolase-fold protein [Candidatus Zixiibacteriota bacterium]
MNARSLVFMILAVVGVTLVSVTGCTDRESPLDDGFASDQVPFQVTTSFSALNLNPLGDTPFRIISVAWASHSPLTESQPPFPVLYLLHDFGADGDYYTRYNLQATLDDMYTKGEIGRMLVVTIGANNSFGGSFYRNSPSSGRYEDVMTEAIDFVENSGTFNVYTNGGKDARAISGHGMGGYGAVRYAMENPSMFSSVSSMSGPLAFDEAWADMMADKIFEENSLTAGDSAAYAALAPDPSKPFTSLMFAMSAAFSPRNLEPFSNIGTCRICANPSQVPCLSFRDCSPCSIFTIVPLAKTTFIFERATGNRAPCSSPVVPQPIGVDLPFDWFSNRVDSVWNLWYGCDARSYLNENPGVLDGIPVYFDCGVNDEYGFLAQNEAFRDALQQAGKTAGQDFFYEEYSGYSALPAGHDELIGERLRKVIKFHSDRLSRPPGS